MIAPKSLPPKAPIPKQHSGSPKRMTIVFGTLEAVS